MILNYLFSRVLEEMLHYQKAHFYKKNEMNYENMIEEEKIEEKKEKNIMI